MRYKYVEAYAIKGLVGPPEEKLIIKDKNFTAYLVSNPDQRLTEIDKQMAIANLMLDYIFTGRPNGKLEELIEGLIHEIRKERSKNKNGYLIIEIWEELQEFKPSAERKVGELHIALDVLDKDSVRNQNKDDIKTALSTLALISNKIIGAEKVTDGLIIYNEKDEIIFPFTFKGGFASAYVSSPLDNSAIKDISKLFNQLKRHKELERVTELLVSSLKSSHDSLRAFLACSIGLEIFVNKLFPSFEIDFFKEINQGDHPEIRGKYLDRIRTVMKDKYKISDKFSIISLRLSPTTVDNDAIIFMRVKQQRDLLVHGQNITDQELDVENAQRLLTAYLKLYLDFIIRKE